MVQAQGRKRTRKQFAAMMNELFQVEMFAEWSMHGNARWRPRNVVWGSLIMCCLPGQTLQERFTAARKIVKSDHHGLWGCCRLGQAGKTTVR